MRRLFFATRNVTLKWWRPLREMSASIINFEMLIPRILAVVCVVTYLLSMCFPAIAARSYYTVYILRGWEVAHFCGLFSFAPSMSLAERATFIVGIISNLLFLFCATSFLVRVFSHRFWLSYGMICWVCAASFAFAVVSVLIGSMWFESLLIGFYFGLGVHYCSYREA